MQGRLMGKRALVTGAASGIGKATALRFAAEGASVGLLDVRPEELRIACEEITPSAGQVVAAPADVSDEAQVEDAFATVAGKLGGLDIVVANAGVQLFDDDDLVGDLDVQVWDRTHAINLRGAFLTCKHGVRALLASGGGSIICTGSPTGMFGSAARFAAYSSSKAGIFGLARVVAAGYAEHGIRCNVVVPGFTATPLIDVLTSDPESMRKNVAGIPLGRAGAAEDVAAMMLFLASDESAYATGGVFTIDGGQTAVLR